jgi:hypothetical protein
MPTQPYAIFHTVKVKTPGGATSATQHNYRLELTPNADPDWGCINEEYLNHEQRNYWHLASERIAELQLPRLREDAVRLVEVLLTASPEAFERDEQGRSQDMRKTSWVQDNLDFMQQRFGKANVIGFMLHQDEITPHIHAMVVPVTADGRLSCRDVFSPATLRQLQTDYAAAMEKHGLQRGILHSTAQHEDVRRHYGAQQMSKEKLAEVASPVKATTFQLEALKPWERVRPQEYVAREQTRLNAYINQLVAEANQKLAQVATVATANTLEGERAKVLEKRLASSQALLVNTREELNTTKTQLQQQQELTTKVQLHHRQAVTRHLQNDPLPQALVTLAQNQRAKHLHEVNQALAKQLCPPLRELTDLAAPLLAKGYGLKVIGPQEVIITHQQEKTRFSTADLQPNGRPLLEQFQQVVTQTNQQILPRDRDNGIEM